MNATVPPGARRGRGPGHAAWTQLVDGYCVDLLEPDLSGLSAGTLAHHLARLNRWCGGTEGPFGYSVAQHTLDVLRAADAHAAANGYTMAPALARAVLLHDAHEAMTGDVPRPVKGLAGPGFREVERRLDAALARRFGLPHPLPPEVAAAVKRADDTALATEARDLLAPSQWEWVWRAPPAMPERLWPWPAEAAEMALAHAFDVWRVV